MARHLPALTRLSASATRLCILSLALLVSACGGGSGGGGGGGGGGGITTPPVSPPTTSPPLPTVPGMPSLASREYERNWGLADVKAHVAWQQEVTGKGVTVAVIDSGVNPAHKDLAANLSSASRDIVSGRNELHSSDTHGAHVASVIAAPFNDFGTVGIAYNSTILSIRADISDCKEKDDKVCFRSTDLARAIDYAVANGARIINLSVGGDERMGAVFENALVNAVRAGVIFAISSGNEEADNPGWPARYAIDPRFAGSIIAVGAHANTGAMASFSNKAGVSQNAYLSAPGRAVVGDCRDDGCWARSGTSFSAPAVAAAMVLLKEAFPNLTGAEIVDILLLSARDAGAPGIDVIWGRGKLDIERAFQPIGATSVPLSASGQSATLNAPGQVYLGSAFGDATRLTTGLTTIAYDQYQRLFTVNLADAYQRAPRASRLGAPSRPMMQSTVTATGPIGTELKLAAAVPVPEPAPLLPRYDLYSAPWMGVEERREAMFEVQGDRFSLAAWQGEGGARSPFRTRAGDSFAALAQADQAMRGTLSLGSTGQWTLSAEQGIGDHRLPLQALQRDAATYARWGLDWRTSSGAVAFSMGQLSERMGPLGSYMPMTSDLALPSYTRFAAMGTEWALTPRLSLMAEGGIGRTDMQGRFLHLSRAAFSSHWRLGLQGQCQKTIWGCESLGLELSQPMRIENGTFEALLADVPEEYFDPVTFSRRRFSAAPTGRQIDLSLRSVHRLYGGSRLQLEATAIHQDQHLRNAKPGYAFAAQWRAGF